MMPRVRLQFVIVVFPDHTHLIFLTTDTDTIPYRLIKFSCLKQPSLIQSYTHMGKNLSSYALPHNYK